METCSSANSEDIFRNSSSSSSSSSGSSGGGGSRNSNSRRYGINISASNLIHAPLTTLLEYSGILRGGGNASSAVQEREQLILPPPSSAATQSTTGAHHQEVTIRIVGAADSNVASTVEAMPASSDDQPGGAVAPQTPGADGASAIATGPSSSSHAPSPPPSYQRYDIQNFARWIEQILPFSLLLLLVFIRQHLQGFCVAMWIAAVLFKSNDILKKQTALKSSFSDAMVRQVAMAFKCILLMHYKNSRGHNYRKQGQMLTLVEYFLLLYRSLLPAPVWYRFFLNKEYGSFFSSLITGLYLTFKLTSALGKVQLFFTALRALSCKEMNHVSYATSEQVNAAGDLCAICQEKMHAPILLRCKHIFCEECVSEWFERERTCPLCRALVKPADIRSYSDGSTSLFFQLF
ncbi:uncharacterized protein LOC110655986 isoform X2 [Hevea brasiliensis]|uniref:uncharacterized protein LOC110655986 isoform X2 n=1 Tax=Hevea brasiliensis TaxID=3981 RepID=UPI0025CE1919|nr:uncharacterized protein LOC110655986 isoform X2 [Hevea brasiliensis]